ncbi:MAG: ABC transporter substrate-binding protein [Anaerocolumna sp.]
MRVVKRIISVLLVTVLAISLSACSSSSKGSSSGNTGSSTDQADKSYTKIVYAFVSFNNIPEDTKEVEEEINKITREKIGVEVELMPLSISEYSKQVSLAMQGGDQIDVFHSLGDFNQSIASNQAYDITDIIDSCAPETKELIGDTWLEATGKEGKIYGIPAYKPIALQPMFIYRSDIAEESGIDMTKVSSIYDLTQVFEKVKEKYPDMTPLIPVNPGDSGMTRCVPEVDYLTDDYLSPKGVLMSDNTTVLDYYSTDEFKNLCSLTRTWYNEGLILQDAATTTSTSTELMSSGNAFGYIASYSYPTKDTAASLKSQVGYDLGAAALGEAFLDTTAINAITWMVSSTSKNPEAALKFLNLTYSEPDVVNLIIYGLEGKDYVKNEDGSVSYPEGLDASTVPYTAQLSCGIVGNQFIQNYMEGVDPASLDWELEQNKNARTSAAMGFTFDASKVKVEYSTVVNVINQYLPALSCGSVDPEKELPKFIERLKEAGLDTIIQEKQAQLDSWLANK